MSGAKISSSAYDVAKASAVKALEDFENILRLEGLPKWNKEDPGLKKLQQIFEAPPNPPIPSYPSVLEILGEAVEEKHQREGGYNEKLLQKRLVYKKLH